MVYSNTPDQWRNLLSHLGTWKGSFTDLSPGGDVQKDVATSVCLQGLDQNQRIRQTNTYFAQNDAGQGEVRVLEYSGLGRGILLFQEGSFSQGSIQFSPVSEFGAEFGFVRGDRRLRLVQLFQPVEAENYLNRLTLIREQREGTDAPERPPLAVAALLGRWSGTAETLYLDGRSPDTYPTSLAIERVDGDLPNSSPRLSQRLTTPTFELASTATIQGNRLLFDRDTTPTQVLLLPDGASSHTPLKIPKRQPFLLEAGWLVQPDLRLRLIRSYDARGTWSSLTLVTERKE